MENSKIEWTDHTFNPWWGCLKVSPGCQHCYAEGLAGRYGYNVWGPAQTTSRRPMSQSYWQQPLKWNQKAEVAGRRARVFCASMADVFEDHPDLPPLRERLFRLIVQTPWLDWLLLTKRPENVKAMVPWPWNNGLPDRVWLGTSIEDQAYADQRIPALLSVAAPVHFLSYEPALGPVVLPEVDRIDWVICGGESGPQARPFHLEWAESIIRQCRLAGVACFIKQLGSNPQLGGGRYEARNAKGGDLSTWPDWLKVRQFPGDL